MKERFFKTAKVCFLMAFLALVISMSLETTTFAAKPKVTNLRQTEGSTSGINISWDAPLGTNKFTIYISENKYFPANATITETAYSNHKYIYNLNPNHTYYIKIIPANVPENTYDFSDVLSCVTAPDTTGTAVHTKSTTSSISVSWNAPTTNAGHYNIYYRVQYDYKSDPVFAGSTTGRTFTVSKLKDNENYTIYIYPVRKSESEFEAAGAARTIDCTTVANVRKLSGIKLQEWSAGSNSAAISFLNDSKFTASPSGIELEISSLSGKKLKRVNVSTTATRAAFSSNSIKNKGFKYRLRTYVKANNRNWYSSYTSQKTVIAHPKVTATKKSMNALLLRWKKISGAKSYTIYVAKTQNGKYRKKATVKSTRYTLKNTKPYKYYYIYVKANGVKSGKKSYSSTKAVKQPITSVYYYKYLKASNYYTIYTN